MPNSIDIALDWPDCIRCGSSETAVCPATDEWTCDECGCQWTPDETPVDDGDAAKIPARIENLLRAVAAHGGTAELHDIATEHGVEDNI